MNLSFFQFQFLFRFGPYLIFTTHFFSSDFSQANDLLHSLDSMKSQSYTCCKFDPMAAETDFCAEENEEKKSSSAVQAQTFDQMQSYERSEDPEYSQTVFQTTDLKLAVTHCLRLDHLGFDWARPTQRLATEAPEKECMDMLPKFPHITDLIVNFYLKKVEHENQNQSPDILENSQSKRIQIFRELVSGLSQKMVAEGAKLERNSANAYDIAIIGGGVLGSALAKNYGHRAKVIVLDSSDGHPSPFSDFGKEFSLNTPVENHTGQYSFINYFNVRNKPAATSAEYYGQKIVFDLFLSGADILFNSYVFQIDQVTTSSARPNPDQANFVIHFHDTKSGIKDKIWAKFVIQATGKVRGKKTFDNDQLREVHSDRLMNAEDFMRKIAHDAAYSEQIEAIIKKYPCDFGIIGNSASADMILFQLKKKFQPLCEKAGRPFKPFTISSHYRSPEDKNDPTQRLQGEVTSIELNQKTNLFQLTYKSQNDTKSTHEMSMVFDASGFSAEAELSLLGKKGEKTPGYFQFPSPDLIILVENNIQTASNELKAFRLKSSYQNDPNAAEKRRLQLQDRLFFIKNSLSQ
jgi:hypothetical protein